MFESDDFDQVLSQFDFPGVVSNNIENGNLLSKSKNVINVFPTPQKGKSDNEDVAKASVVITKELNFNNQNTTTAPSPKHTKRKIINSYFDPKNKRKFPGPAGLLSGIEEPKDESIYHIELLSQDIDSSQNNLRRDLFDSPLWHKLLAEVKEWKLNNIDTVKAIKQQAITGNLRRRKAQIVTAFVEAIDRSGTDPLIILRDTTGTIKCTLHRDAWTTFSSYVMSEYCAFVLWKPTILTTGSAFKKHYLNITLSNILAIYSSALLNDEEDNKNLPEGYTIVYEEDFTVIKSETCLKNSDSFEISWAEDSNSNDLLDGLDSIFSDEVF